MKTSTPFFPIFLSFMLLLFGTSSSADISIENSITVEFKRGRGSDCFGTGRECFSMESINLPSDYSEFAEGIGVIYFDTNNQFILEITNVFDSQLSSELSMGSFILDSDVAVPTELLIELGKPSDTFILHNGVYAAEAIDGSIYRIVFN